MKLKESSASALTIGPMVLYLVLALQTVGSSQEDAPPEEEVKKMRQEIGGAEPDYIIGQPRLQKVEGFHYFYMELKHTDPGQAGPLARKAHDTYARVIGESYRPTLLVMFFSVPDEPNVYDIQTGFSVRKGTVPIGEAKVRYVEPTLCVSLLAWGDIGVYAKSYAPLIEFAEEKGLKCKEGFREWDLYWEGDRSKNNIILVQHPVEEE